MNRVVAVMPYLMVAALMLSGATTSRAQAQPEGYDGRRSAYWSYAWERQGDTVGPRGLRLLDSGPGGFVTRWLVVDQERGWRMFLTETLDPCRGVQTTDILDDVSGWWIRLESRVGVRGESLEDYFARARELPSIDEATGFLDYRLIATGDFSFSPRIPARGATKDVIWDGLFDQLGATGLRAKLAASVPEDFRAAVLFLDVSLMEWSSAMQPGGVADRPRDWPGLLGLLARVVRSELLPDDPQLAEFATPWTMRRIGPTGRGSSLVEPELLELVSHFRSVENADPLAGSRVEDCAAPPPPP